MRPQERRQASVSVSVLLSNGRVSYFFFEVRTGIRVGPRNVMSRPQ